MCNSHRVLFGSHEEKLAKPRTLELRAPDAEQARAWIAALVAAGAATGLQPPRVKKKRQKASTELPPRGDGLGPTKNKYIEWY